MLWSELEFAARGLIGAPGLSAAAGFCDQVERVAEDLCEDPRVWPSGRAEAFGPDAADDRQGVAS